VSRTRIRRSANRSEKWGRERGQRLAPGGPISDCEAPPGEPYAAETAQRWLRRDRTQGIVGEGERRQQGLTRRALSEMPEVAKSPIVPKGGLCLATSPAVSATISRMGIERVRRSAGSQ